MKKIAITLLLAGIHMLSQAQTSNREMEAIKKTVNTVFEGMKKCDSAMVRSVFAPGAILQTIRNAKDGNSGTVTGDRMEPWLKAIAQPKIAEQIWDERMTFDQILIDGNMAQVWGSYTFYLGSKISHCGTDNMTLVKYPEGWKIVYLIDTSRKEKCQ
ncbi:MAG: nuclear transport factor 2 family protein [Sphingobacteriaceae bacterium]